MVHTAACRRFGDKKRIQRQSLLANEVEGLHETSDLAPDRRAGGVISWKGAGGSAGLMCLLKSVCQAASQGDLGELLEIAFRRLKKLLEFTVA